MHLCVCVCVSLWPAIGVFAQSYIISSVALVVSGGLICLMDRIGTGKCYHLEVSGED